jgi:putative heme transporter
VSRQGEGAPARRGRPWRRVVAVAVTLGVLLAVFAGVFPRFAHYSQGWSSIQRIPAAFVIAIVAAAVVNIAVSAWPLQAALPGLGYRSAFVVGQTSYAMSNALPGGGAVALGVKYDMLGSYGFGTAAAAGATAISAVFNILATLAMPVLSVLALLLYGQLHWQYVLIAIVGSAVVGLSGAAMAAVLRSEDGARRVGRRLDRYLNPLVRRLRRGRGVDVSGKVLDFRSHVVGVMRARWPAVVGSTLLPLFTSWSVLLLGCAG